MLLEGDEKSWIPYVALQKAMEHKELCQNICSINIPTDIIMKKCLKIAIKKNTFELVLMRWMKLEPIIQSEVSQKEKHQYSILMHIYGI